MKSLPLIACAAALSLLFHCKQPYQPAEPPSPEKPPVEASPIRGVWVTTTASTALQSTENIKQTVANCKAAGMNHIFVVVYNNARTIYPSTVMQNLIGKPILEAFQGRDPLQELIDAAHAADIKVYAWFEYGFSSSYSAKGGLILQAKPAWASQNSSGNLVVKNGFDWLNAFHPEVQDFVMSLIKEVVTKYNVDGIQGDDRLPAMPSEGGYDPYTVTLYKAENGGAEPHTFIKEEYFAFQAFGAVSLDHFGQELIGWYIGSYF